MKNSSTVSLRGWFWIIAVPVLVAIYVAIYFLMGNISNTGARGDLLEEYEHVISVTQDRVQFSCTRDKHRTKHDFVALRKDGTQVTGYICYTGMLDIFGSKIHEN